MEYSAKVLEHFANPHNVGKIDDADGIGEVGNAKCGDIMKMYIKVKDDVITDVKFNTYGCASAIATSSIATDMIKGKPISEALKLTNKAVVEALDGLPAVKIHCSVLAEEAIKAAVKDYYDKNGIQYDEELFKPDNCHYTPQPQQPSQPRQPPQHQKHRQHRPLQGLPPHRRIRQKMLLSE